MTLFKVLSLSLTHTYKYLHACLLYTLIMHTKNDVLLNLKLSPIPEILSAFRNATHCATKWAKAWHIWALFNTAVMSHYTLRGFPNVAAQYVVAAVNGYFHSIACAAHAKGVDDSLQVIPRSENLFLLQKYLQLFFFFFLFKTPIFC